MALVIFHLSISKGHNIFCWIVYDIDILFVTSIIGYINVNDCRQDILSKYDNCIDILTRKFELIEHKTLLIWLMIYLLKKIK